MARHPQATFALEQALLDAGECSRASPVAGVDEAGRGPLAGPVVAAAVILSPDTPPAGLGDSKTLPEATRNRLFDAILETAHVGVGIMPPATIDRLNIRGATLLAMARAVDALPVTPGHVLVDGRDTPPIGHPATAIIGGDGTSLSIAAASIIAKVWRDRIMAELDVAFPAYGWARNKGYPTADHRAVLMTHGPSPHHRHSFAPVRLSADALINQRTAAATPA
ncbi:MAG: ribonuclease HII [Pseudomonadota bacterium]